MEKQLYIQPRVGIYKDNHPDSQTEYYDDLTIKFTPDPYIRSLVLYPVDPLKPLFSQRFIID